jgi:cell division septum initiation protein DivIVA
MPRARKPSPDTPQPLRLQQAHRQRDLVAELRQAFTGGQIAARLYRDSIAELTACWEELSKFLRQLPNKTQETTRAAHEGPALMKRALDNAQQMVSLADKHGNTNTEAVERSAQRLQEERSDLLAEKLGLKAKKKRLPKKKETLH